MLDRLTASHTCSGSPALPNTHGGYTIDITVGSLRIYTPEPITEAAARDYARLLSDSFGIDGNSLVTPDESGGHRWTS